MKEPESLGVEHGECLAEPLIIRIRAALKPVHLVSGMAKINQQIGGQNPLRGPTSTLYQQDINISERGFSIPRPCQNRMRPGLAKSRYILSTHCVGWTVTASCQSIQLVCYQCVYLESSGGYS
jgi:hypothetical protein